MGKFNLTVQENKQISQIIAEANIIYKANFVKTWEEYQPQLAKFLWSFNTGGQKTVSFVIRDFVKTFYKFLGQRVHQAIPDGKKFTIACEAWDMAIDIDEQDLLAATSVDGINFQIDQASNIPVISQNHDMDRMLDLLIAGAGTTLGYCFDDEAFFSASHSYLGATSQSNIVTGTGVTLDKVIIDTQSVLNKFSAFYYTIKDGDGNTKYRSLNRGEDLKIHVICPSGMKGVFQQLMNGGLVILNATGGSVDNTVGKNISGVTALPGLSDQTDWYAIADDNDPMVKPFLRAVQMELRPDYPVDNKQLLNENGKVVYGGRKFDAVTYGAWWKAVKVTNT